MRNTRFDRRAIAIFAAAVYLSAATVQAEAEAKLLSRDHVNESQYTLKVYVGGREVTEQLELHEGKNLIKRSYMNGDGQEITLIHEVYFDKPAKSVSVFQAFMEKLRVSYSVFMSEISKVNAPGGGPTEETALAFFKMVISECQVILNVMFKNSSRPEEAPSTAQEPTADVSKQFFEGVIQDSQISINALASNAERSAPGDKSAKGAVGRVREFFDMILNKTEVMINYFGSPSGSQKTVAKNVVFKGPGHAELSHVSLAVETPPVIVKKLEEAPNRAVLAPKTAKWVAYESKPSSWKESIEEEAALIEKEEKPDFTGISTKVIFPDEQGGMTMIIENQRTEERTVIYKDSLGRELRRRSEPLRKETR